DYSPVLAWLSTNANAPCRTVNPRKPLILQRKRPFAGLQQTALDGEMVGWGHLNKPLQPA
ncbi:MAG: hypothetical protein Q7K13_07270, partial [Polynucleobacter sp.]|uniref:hypothetical protein n=1 Tax=Polynucleobacter sp. TaxID=2029855 RepID=UPI00271C0F22